MFFACFLSKDQSASSQHLIKTFPSFVYRRCLVDIIFQIIIICPDRGIAEVPRILGKECCYSCRGLHFKKALLQRFSQICNISFLLLSQVYFDKWLHYDFFSCDLLGKINLSTAIFRLKNTCPVSFHVTVFHIKFPTFTWFYAGNSECC